MTTVFDQIGDRWPGAGQHAGHVITLIEKWPPRNESVNGRNRLTCCRVRCTCGEEWDAGGFPIIN